MQEVDRYATKPLSNIKLLFDCSANDEAIIVAADKAL
jgi:hypothetical protein